jgi:hypothetical protein
MRCAGLAKQGQGRLHFVPRMHIPRFLRDDNSVGKKFARLIEPPETRKELAELEISRGVAGIGFEELVEMASGGIVVTELDAFQGQAVPREGVGWFLGDELLELFASRFL